MKTTAVMPTGGAALSPSQVNQETALAAEHNFMERDRIARIVTTDSLVIADLLFSKVREDHLGSSRKVNSEAGWQRFKAVGTVTRGRSILFRLADDSEMVTSPVTSVYWLGAEIPHLDPRDVEAMKIIGDMLSKPKRPQRWWRRD